MPIYLISSLRKEKRIFVDPEIVPFYSGKNSFQSGQKVYNLFLEYEPPETLEGLIATSGGCSLPENDVRDYTKMILKGLDRIHKKGFVHCDIKPKNILVFSIASNDDDSCKYRLKIGDFGAAMKPGQKIEREFWKGKIRGTMLYTSPESVLRGEIGPALDIWSLGCTVLKMVTGENPWRRILPATFTGDDFIAFLADKTLEIPKSMSESGKDFLRKCLEKDPSKRWSAPMLLKHPYITGTVSNQSRERRCCEKMIEHVCLAPKRIVKGFCMKFFSDLVYFITVVKILYGKMLAKYVTQEISTAQRKPENNQIAEEDQNSGTSQDIINMPRGNPWALTALLKELQQYPSDHLLGVTVTDDCFSFSTGVLYVSIHEDVIPLLNMDLITSTCIAVYMKFLYDEVVNREELGKFEFVDPSLISQPGGRSTIERAKDLAKRFKIQSSEIPLFTIIPYNICAHWMLVLVELSKEQVYFLDPLNNKAPSEDLRIVLTEAFGIFKNQPCDIKIIVPKCPRQFGNYECGYYICYMIKRIVFAYDPMSFVLERCGICKQYPQCILDEVREDWAKFLLEKVF